MARISFIKQSNICRAEGLQAEEACSYCAKKNIMCGNRDMNPKGGMCMASKCREARKIPDNPLEHIDDPVDLNEEQREAAQEHEEEMWR